MKSGKHILLLTPGFPAHAEDYLCLPPVQVFLRKYQALYPADRISVVTFQYPYTTAVYTWNGISVYPCGGANRRWRKLSTWKKVRSYVQQIHREYPVDLFHSLWWGECARLGSELAQQFSLPHIHTLMGQDVLPENKLLRRSDLHADAIAALCPRHAEQYIQSTGRQPNVIIPWGIDATELPTAPAIRDIHIVGAGGFIPLKRYALFVDAIAALVPEFPTLRTVLIGYGPEEKKLRRQIAERGLQEHIHLPGLLPRPQVLEYFSRSRVLLHPSSFESFGYVYSEALACGASVVSFATGWAKPSDRWQIVSQSDEIKPLMKILLSQDLSTAPSIPVTAADTATAYYELYRQYGA